MSRASFRVHQVKKRYAIGAARASTSLRETIVQAFKAPFRRLRAGGGPPESTTLWALDGVSFDIEQGEVVGIIGRNGAGKSTMLKVLSRITEPTEGRIEVTGRVGSLLEVGTGFHPELTGRENIYLNGAILGMQRAEIRKKFDEIVAFAEVAKFLDTPVKYYSSGMYVRLAFAVAAHLEPEILLVDEVLAVGDASFQRKCLAKMEDVGQHGRTVIFVSHSMPAVARLCRRAILLEKGKVLRDGNVSDVVVDYLRSGYGTTALREWSPAEAPGNEVARLLCARVVSDGKVTQSVDIRHEVSVEIEYEVREGGHRLTPNFHFFNEEGHCVFVSLDADRSRRGVTRPPGRYRSQVTIPGNFLAEGLLTVNVAMSTLDPVKIHFHELEAVAFQVRDSLDGDSARGDFGGALPGVVRPMLPWSTQPIDDDAPRASQGAP